MDGNGRWARAQGKNRLWGHDQGYRTLKNIVYAADDLGVRYLTVYGFSSENWRRSQEEVGGLMELMLQAMRAEIEELIQNNVRVRVSGRMRDLPPDLRAEFEDAMQRTADFTGLTFNLGDQLRRTGRSRGRRSRPRRTGAAGAIGRWSRSPRKPLPRICTRPTFPTPTC